MSIYRDTNSDVVFEHPHPGPLTAVVYRKGFEILTVENLMPEVGRYKLSLNYNDTRFEGQLEIHWIAENFERIQYVDVRTPIVPLNRLRTAFSDENWTDAELSELESSIRSIIEAHTGQKFGYEVARKRVVGTGDRRVALPGRLAKLNSVTSDGPVGYYAVTGDGWYLMVTNKKWLTTKEMPPEELDSNVVWTGVKGVIHVPDSYWRKFRFGAYYEIDGEWGYQSVPEDVQEAAMLLAADYGSGENLYRDRYLEAIKSGDWNLTYSGGAYRGTGNARADQLLDKYRRKGMVII